MPQTVPPCKFTINFVHEVCELLICFTRKIVFCCLKRLLIVHYFWITVCKMMVILLQVLLQIIIKPLNFCSLVFSFSIGLSQIFLKFFDFEELFGSLTLNLLFFYFEAISEFILCVPFFFEVCHHTSNIIVIVPCIKESLSSPAISRFITTALTIAAELLTFRVTWFFRLFGRDRSLFLFLLLFLFLWLIVRSLFGV